MRNYKPLWNRYDLLRKLQRIYDELAERHYANAPRNGIPVGGGEWMDCFFRMEGLRGIISALESGKNLQDSLAFGKDTSTVAVKIWNQRREWQVHRWEQTAHSFLESTIRRLVDGKR